MKETITEIAYRVESFRKEFSNITLHGIRPVLATVGNSITLWFLCDNDISVLSIWTMVFSGHLRQFIENLFRNLFGEEHMNILLRINFKEFKQAQMAALSKLNTF